MSRLCRCGHTDQEHGGDTGSDCTHLGCGCAEFRETAVSWAARNAVTRTLKQITCARCGHRQAYEVGDPPCPDCARAARHAYADSDNPGFFHTRCERHRAPDIISLESATMIATMIINRVKELQADGYTHYQKQSLGRLLLMGLRLAVTPEIKDNHVTVKIDTLKGYLFAGRESETPATNDLGTLILSHDAILERDLQKEAEARERQLQKDAKRQDEIILALRDGQLHLQEQLQLEKTKVKIREQALKTIIDQYENYLVSYETCPTPALVKAICDGGDLVSDPLAEEPK